MAGLASDADWMFIPECPPEKGWEDLLCKRLAQVRNLQQRIFGAWVIISLLIVMISYVCCLQCFNTNSVKKAIWPVKFTGPAITKGLL